METPKLICDKDIAPFDTWALMFDEPQPVFSSTTAREFLDANQDATEIIFEIRSDGGSTSEARIIYDMIRNSGKKIITHGYKCNSSAMILFLSGDERLVSENSDNIIHPVWIDAFGLPWQLTAEDMRLFADEIEQEQAKLLDIYCSVIGEDKREEVSTKMAASTNLNADECVRLGFATGKLSGTETVNSKRSVVFTNKMFKAVLQNKQQTKNTKEMDFKKEVESFTNGLTLLNKALEKLGIKNNADTPPAPDPKNASVGLAEGGSIYFDGELAEGTAVFTDEAMTTKAPEGEHKLADGRVITVDAEGKVTAIAAAMAENKEVEELKNEVASLKTTVEAQTESLKGISDTLNKLAPVLDGMKNLVPGGTGKDYMNRSTNPVIEKDPKNMTNLEKKRARQGK